MTGVNQSQLLVWLDLDWSLTKKNRNKDSWPSVESQVTILRRWVTFWVMSDHLKTRSNGVQRGQTGQTGPNGAKWGQIGPNGAKCNAIMIWMHSSLLYTIFFHFNFQTYYKHLWNTYEICKHYIQKEQILSKYESIIYDDIMLSWFECIRAFYILGTCYLFPFKIFKHITIIL